MNNWLERHKGIVFGFLLLVTLIGGGIFYLRQPDPPPLEIDAPEPTATATEVVAEVVVDTPTSLPTPIVLPTSTATPSPLRIYVTGEVHSPNVYYLPPGSIIRDALDAAGGATHEADLVAINLAQELQDQQQITIPAKTEARPTPPPIEGGVPPTATPQPAQPSSAPAAPSDTGQEAAPAGQKININTASLDALTTLPGVGPSIGQRIIDYRTEHGPFAAIEGLMDVKGIGQATFAKMKDQVTVQ
jgi:competence protein ComEA